MAVPGELPGLMTPPRLDGHGVATDVHAIGDFEGAATRPCKLQCRCVCSRWQVRGFLR